MIALLAKFFRRKPALKLVPSLPANPTNEALDRVRAELAAQINDANERCDRLLERLRSREPEVAQK